MRILFITATLPFPATDGPRIRIFSFIRSLSTRHAVSVVSFVRDLEDAAALEPLRSYCETVQAVLRNPRYSASNLFRGLVGSTAFPVLHYRDPRMAESVKSVIREGKFDIVQAEGLHTAQYALGLEAVTVLDLHNIESSVMKRYAGRERNLLKRAYARITARKLAAYERKVCRLFNCCLTCSDTDRSRLQIQGGIDQIRVISNGVDTDAFAPNGTALTAPQRIVFVGRMDYHANVDAVRWFGMEVLPLIRAHRPDTLFQIVGGYPTNSVKQLAKPGQVEVTGRVKDVRPYLAASTMVVAPLRVGGGTRLKILEALAMEKAIVSTSVGAEGIAIVPGKDVLIADDPQEFARKVVKVLDNEHERKRLGTAGRHLARRQYDWKAIAQRLERVYQECLEGIGGANGAVRER